MSTVPVSVIIPTRNRFADLKICLEAVLRQTVQPQEIIVVDNASSDETAQVLESFKQVIVLRYERNIGAAAARNRALALAQCRYAWFLDSDTEVTDAQCLERMVDAMDKAPGFGSIGGEMVKLADGSAVMRVKSVDRNGHTVVCDVGHDNTEFHDCDYLATCNCMVRTETVREIGGFDEAYFYLSEDKQLGLDLRKKGLRNIASTWTSALHRMTRDREPRSLYLKQRNIIRYVLLNGTAGDILLWPFRELLYLARMPRMLEKESGRLVAAKYTGDSSGAGTALKYGLAGIGAMLWNCFMLPVTLTNRLFRSRRVIRPVSPG